MAVTGMVAQARQLSPDEALGRFVEHNLPTSQHTGQMGRKVRAKAPAAQYRLAYTGRCRIGTGLYVFDAPREGGYVILAADDAVPAVLGYTDSGHFCAEAMPDGLRYWMECMLSDINTSMSTGQPFYSSARRVEGRHAVSPLMDCKWAQEDPYNFWCPEIDRRSTLVGCVAAAMGQVMYKYKWPRQGTGSHSYTNGETGTTVSADFGSTTYDWDNIQWAYGRTSTNAENYNSTVDYSLTAQSAVARLLFHCGVSVDMQYNTAQGGGSGADIQKASLALSRYFGYDRSLRFCPRACYTDDQWVQTIYDELAAGRPVMYGGTSSSGGAHAFVLNGYSEDGLFHVNWGWSGIADGYYAITGSNHLCPSLQVTGYTQKQRIIIGIRPDEGNEVAVNLGFLGTGLSISNGSLVATAQLAEPLANYTPYEVSAYLGVRLENTATGQVYYTRSSTAPVTLSPDGTYSANYAISTEGVPSGRYRVSYAVCSANEGGQWYDVMMPSNIVLPEIEVQGQDMPEDFTLNDGETYTASDVATYKTLTYTRTFNNTNWQALYIPFSLNYEEWKDDFDIAEIHNFIEYDDDEDGTFDRTYLVILRRNSGDTDPNYPYLIRAKSTGTHTLTLSDKTLQPMRINSVDCRSVKNLYTFIGTYQPVTTMYANGYYALSGGALNRANSASVKLGAQRWYMEVTSRSGGYASAKAQTIQIIEEGEEGIGSVLRQQTTDNGQGTASFDLAGRKVLMKGGAETLPQGVTIVGGKKVIR